MIYNPWKRIRELEARNAQLEYMIENGFERLERVTSDAVYHGIEREVYRRRQIEAENAMLLKNAVDVASTMPSSWKFSATTLGGSGEQR